MWQLEPRSRYSSDGLRDDLILIGGNADFSELSDALYSVVHINTTDSYSLPIRESYRIDIKNIEIDEKSDGIEAPYLYGPDLEKSNLPISDRPLISLGNEDDTYDSMDDWNERKILKISGCRNGLLSIAEFLNNPIWHGEMNYAYLKAAYEFDSVLHPNSCDLRINIERD